MPNRKEIITVISTKEENIFAMEKKRK